MIEDRIAELINEPLNLSGYRLLKVSLNSAAKRKNLQLIAEKKDSSSLSIEDCSKITKLVSALLEEEDIISSAFNLEVSSPGLDRPLISFEDYRRYEGFLISLKTKPPIDGSRKFKGRMAVKVDKEIISLTDDKNVEILSAAFEDIDSAKIVITDELFKTKGKIN